MLDISYLCIKQNHVYSTGCNNQMYFLLVYLSAYEFVSFQKQFIDEL